MWHTFYKFLDIFWRFACGVASVMFFFAAIRLYQSFGDASKSTMYALLAIWCTLQANAPRGDE